MSPEREGRGRRATDMGLSQAISELLSRLKPGTSQALIVILGVMVGFMSSGFAQAWWITTHGPAYAAAEVKRYSEMADEVTELKRWREKIDEERNREKEERTQDRTLVWDLKGDMREIKGQLNILLRRTR